jgi:hypothetical protein
LAFLGYDPDGIDCEIERGVAAGRVPLIVRWETHMWAIRSVRSFAVLVILAMTSLLLVQLAESSQAAIAAGQQPRFERTIGGQGRPGVFAWGVQYNPVTDEVLVGDYLNFKIRRYDKQGNALGDFYRPDHLGQPYSIAVDPNDGAIYVAELKDNPLTAAIVKYDKFGNYLYAANASLSSSSGNRFRAFYPVWMTVEEDTGDIWVLDSHYQNIGTTSGGLSEENPPRMLQLHFNDATQTVDELGAWAVTPPGSSTTNQARIYGIDITSDDRIYMTDAWNRRAYIYNRDGTYVSTFGTTQTGGDNRSVVVNEAIDRLYVVDAEHSDVDMFRMDGTYISSFGSEGDGPGQFAGGGRQIDIDNDGNLWVGDFGGFEVEKFSPTGTPLLTAPSPARKPPGGFFAQPRDAAVDDATGDVWVADAWGQRFQRFSSTGAFLGAWGKRGPGGPFDMNYPRSIAIQQATATTPKRVWVVNERGHHIQVYNYPTTTSGAPTYVRQLGQIGSDDTDNGHFRWPGDVEFYTRPDGTQVAVITDRMASSVKVLNAVTFQEIDMTPAEADPNTNFIPVTSAGTAIDPATGNIWIGNGTRIRVYDQAGTLVVTYGASGTALGQFQDIADLTYCNGQMYVVDERQAKITVANLDGTFVSRWGQTFGQNPYDFKGPAGIDCDAQGRVYVADSGNDRIQVFSTNNVRTYEAVAPSTPVVSSPAQSSVLPLASVTMTGTAADNSSIGNVEVSVKDAGTGLWWDSADASWETTKTYSLASYTAGTAPATSVSWRFVFPGVTRQGRYLAEVRARDHNGNVSQSTVRSFAMTGATPPPIGPPTTADNVRPDGRLLFPAPPPQPAANLPLGTVHFSGDASDNMGVTNVRVALKNNANGRWWTGTGSSGFSTTYTTWEATLTSPGGTSTGWSWDWLPRAAGTYTISVEARDAAGNVDPSKPNVVFNVTSEAPDTVPPDTDITQPAAGASLPTGNVSMTGTATDDRQVTAVRLAIVNGSGQYWTGSGWSTTSTTVNAAVTGGGTASATWSYTLTGGTADGYVVTATAVDASNNVDASPASRSFTLSGAPDTTAPTPTVTAPSQVNATAPLPTVSIRGNVTDDRGTAAVRISIQDTVSKLWWTGSGWGSFTNLPTALEAPGSTSTSWSYDFTPPAAGRYGYQVTAVDGAGNVSAKTAFRTVTMQ